MDASVIAALITTPTAVLAAGAAFAAGRVQGRGSVDAVRRQHQRESYADLVGAAHALLREVKTWHEGDTALTVAQVRIRNLQQEVERAAVIASLEGPSHLQTFINTIEMSAIIIEDRAGRFDGTTAELAEHIDDHIGSADSATYLFAEVARDYLNSGKQRKRLLAKVQAEHRRIRSQQVGLPPD
ncbi:hypothetical protein [Streptomyces sp. NBC_00356]|uniref:hypothetical protein n=1 Tax=Streptomyces sp. NBC_00356 TaxID=2975724 RepID=UPI002E255B20